jgi:hypothetical protein
MFLTPIIILFSLATFITSGISKAIETAIARGNTLAVTLGDQLRAVESNKESQIVPRDLQEFVSIIRALDTYAWQLNLYIAYIDVDGYLTVSDLWSRKPKLIPEFQIEPGDAAKPDVAKQKIKVYQGVRDFADRVKETVTLIYGAMGSCILSVLYALLGACAYILRSIEEHYKRRTLNPTDTHTVRFVTAVIGGAVVGLFPNFSVNQTPTISPLAIAFLVGYAIDVFFSFLDSLLQPFTRRGNPPPETKATG